MNTYYLGTGISEVTDPAVGKGMQGFARKRQKTTGVETPLYSRAFIIWDRQTDQRVVMAVVDIWSCTQAVKDAVIERLSSLANGAYSRHNVLISGTHTHSGPGGYSHYYLYNYSVGGFDLHTFECIISGIVRSIQQAHDNLAVGKIYLNQGLVDDCGRQRSLAAYNNNRPDQRLCYNSDTDQEMLLFKFVHLNGKREVAIGMLNWYALHPTDRGQYNTLISGDSKGYAAELFETEMSRHSSAQVPFVAAFANANGGDVSGNVEFGHIPNGIDDIAHMRLHGEKQFRVAKALFDSAKVGVTGSVDFSHTYVDMAQATGLPAALGLSMFAGSTEDGKSGSGLREGITTGDISLIERVTQTLIRQALAFQLARFGITIPAVKTLATSIVAGHRPKPITLVPGLASPFPITPNIQPLQLLKIGQVVITGIPAELTTMAGRYLREAVLKELAEVGVTACALATYANGYSQYVTTKAEYDMQHYEGASTLFGPYTLRAYIDHYRRLARALKRGDQLPTRPMPPNLADLTPTLRRVPIRNRSAPNNFLHFWPEN